MNDERSISLALPGSLSEFFLCEQSCASTFSSFACKALDKANRVSVGLWVSRGSLNSAQSVAFAERMEKMRAKAGITEIRSFGVDSNGTAFVAMSNLDGVKITAEPADMRERERRFLMCLKAVEKVHAAGLVCGELCADSFFMSRSGVVRLIGVVGALPITQKPPEEELLELVPYTRAGERQWEYSIADDVYALGVLGYRLFSGEYPNSQKAPVEPLRPTNSQVPGWVDELLVPLLNRVAEDAPKSAGVLAERVKLFKERELSAQLAPAPVGPEKTERPAGPSDAVQVRLSTPIGEARPGQLEAVASKKPRASSQRRVFAAIVFVFFVAFFVEGRALLTWFTSAVVGPEIAEVQPEDVPITITGGGTLEERREQLNVIFASEDPVAHDTLLRRLRSVKNPSERDFIVSGLLDRSQRLGLALSTAQARSWIKDLNFARQQPAVGGGPSSAVTEEQVLKVVDPLLPTPLRVDLLKKSYDSDPARTTLLAASLALDAGQVEAFLPFIAQYAKESSSIGDAEKHSIFSLILIMPDLAKSLADLVGPKVDQIPDDDLVWLLKEMVSRGTGGIKTISSQLISRQLVTGPRVLYLKELGGIASVPKVVELSLVSSAVSGPRREDVATFSNWYSPAAASTLLLVSLTTNDDALSALAFDALASKPLPDQSLAALIEVIRAIPQADKGRAARIAAALSFESKLSDEELSNALRGLQASGAMQSVIGSALKSSSARVVNELLQQYGTQIGSGLILDVLKHPDPKVRIKGIEILSVTGSLAAQNDALDLYLKEKDADVLAAYKRVLEFEGSAPAH